MEWRCKRLLKRNYLMFLNMHVFQFQLKLWTLQTKMFTWKVTSNQHKWLKREDIPIVSTNFKQYKHRTQFRFSKILNYKYIHIQNNRFCVISSNITKRTSLSLFDWVHCWCIISCIYKLIESIDKFIDLKVYLFHLNCS